MERRAEDNSGDPKALPRNTARFKSLFPNGRAEIKPGATPTLGFVTSYQLVAATEAPRQLT